MSTAEVYKKCLSTGKNGCFSDVWAGNARADTRFTVYLKAYYPVSKYYYIIKNY